MSVTVRRGDPRSPEGRRLLGASHALLASLYPAEDNHHLGVEQLAAPHVAFWVAEDRGEALGCVALAWMGDRGEAYGEVKSLFVDPDARGRGVAAALLAALEDHARAEGLTLLRLETGDTMGAAQRLYARAGFVARGPFGDYREGPHSVFMERAL